LNPLHYSTLYQDIKKKKKKNVTNETTKQNKNTNLVQQHPGRALDDDHPCTRGEVGEGAAGDLHQPIRISTHYNK
jgi:hypothetical protein